MAKADKPKGKAGRPIGRVRTRHVAVEFHPNHDEKHYPQSWELFRNALPAAFQAITGLPKGLMRDGHVQMLNRAKIGYPKMRKSALRLFMEGALTDGDPVLRSVPVGAMRRLENVLSFLDVLETLVYIEGAKQLDKLDLMSAPKNPYKYRPVALRAKKQPAEPKKDVIMIDDPDEPCPMTDEQIKQFQDAICEPGGLEVLLSEGVDTEYEEDEEDGDEETGESVANE